MRETRAKLTLVTAVRATIVVGRRGAWLAGRLQGLALALDVLLLLLVRYLYGLVIVVALLVGDGTARLSRTRRSLKAHVLALPRVLLSTGRAERRRLVHV